MKLGQLIPQKAVVVNLRGGKRSKREVIEDLVAVFYDAVGLDEPGVTREEVLEALLQREREQSTGLGEGFAFPHARFPKLKSFYMLVAVCPEGVEFDSLDGEPSHFFVASLVPVSKANLLLQSRAAVMRFFMDPARCAQIRDGISAEALWQMLDESGESIEHDILARHIMRPAVAHISQEATLAEAARELHRNHTDSLPILGENNRFVADLCCHDLFSFGLPNFFSNLKKISFVKHMDPFEKYFQMDTQMKVGDLKVDRSWPVIPAEATIMEIMFEITVKNCHTLYVLDGERLVGVIDRHSIIDKILLEA